jgi:hypothetical protein
MKYVRILLGASLWAAGAIASAGLLLADRGGEKSALSLLFHYFGEESSYLKVRFPNPVWLEVGDEVRLEGQEPRDGRQQIAGRVIGEVNSLLDERGKVRPAIYDWARAAQIRLYDKRGGSLHAGASARLVRVPQTAAWVVQTLFTAETIPKIAAEWNQTMLAHREEIFAVLTPIVRDSIFDLERHVEKEMPSFLERHQDEVRGIQNEMQRDVTKEKFTELFERELWPIVRLKLQPLVEKVSEEVWQKLPLWTLAWRYVYQSLPLTDNDQVLKTFSNFLEEQALPIFKAHSDDILKATREIARETFSDPKVAEALRQTFSSLLSSPKFHALCQVFLREVFLDNPRFHQAVEERWRSREVASAVEAAAAHLEPMVRRMGDIVLGTRQEGITREFARVLRSQILLKDLQRIVIDPGAEGQPELPAGAELEGRVEWGMAK